MNINLDPQSEHARQAADDARAAFTAYLQAAESGGHAVLNSLTSSTASGVLDGVAFGDIASGELAATRVAYMQAAWLFLTYSLVQGTAAYCSLAADEVPAEEVERVEVIVGRMRKAVALTYEDLLNQGWTLTSNPEELE